MESCLRRNDRLNRPPVAPAALRCSPRLPIMAFGSRATGRELFPNVRGEHCRSSTTRANRWIFNGLRHPSL